MGIGNDRRLALGGALEIELGELHRRPVPRVEAVEPRAGVAAGGRSGKLEARMAPDEARRERPGEARRTGHQHSRLTHEATRRSPQARP